MKALLRLSLLLLTLFTIFHTIEAGDIEDFMGLVDIVKPDIETRLGHSITNVKVISVEQFSQSLTETNKGTIEIDGVKYDLWIIYNNEAKKYKMEFLEKVVGNKVDWSEYRKPDATINAYLPAMIKLMKQASGLDINEIQILRYRMKEENGKNFELDTVILGQKVAIQFSENTYGDISLQYQAEPVPVQPVWTDFMEPDDHVNSLIPALVELFNKFQSYQITTFTIVKYKILRTTDYNEYIIYISGEGLSGQIAFYEYPEGVLKLHEVDVSIKTVGGWSEWVEPDDSIKVLYPKFMSALFIYTKIKIVTFKILSYSKQTIAGFNYKIKAEINGKEVNFEATEDVQGNMKVTTSESYPEQEPDNTGAWSEFKAADEDILSKKAKLKELIFAKTNRKIETFKILKYKFQTVKGTNYEIKAQINGGEVTIVAFESLEGQLTLTSVTEYPKVEIAGGWSAYKPADASIFTQWDIRGLIEKFTGIKIKKFELMKYRKQTVQGYNYEILAQINGKSVTIMAYENLEKVLTIKSVTAYPDLKETTGGWSEVMEISEHLVAKQSELMSLIEAKTSIKIVTFVLLKYKKQTVAGYNYKIQAEINGAKVTIEAFENTEGKFSITQVGKYPEMQLPGGWSEFMSIDGSNLDLVLIRKLVEQFTKRTIQLFSLIEYRKQTVKGYNYEIKANINGAEVVIVLYEDLEGHFSVTSVGEYPEMQLPGGWSKFMAVEATSFASINLKELIEKFTGVLIEEYKLIKYRKQTVKGYNYEIIAMINKVEVTIVLYEDLEGHYSITSVTEYPKLLKEGWSDFMDIPKEILAQEDKYVDLIYKKKEIRILTFKLLKYKYNVKDGKIVGYEFESRINGQNKVFKYENTRWTNYQWEISSCPTYSSRIMNFDVAWTQYKPADEAILKLQDRIVKRIEEYSGKTIKTFEITKYKYQKIDGYNMVLWAKINGKLCKVEFVRGRKDIITILSTSSFPEVVREVQEITGGWTEFMEPSEKIKKMINQLQILVQKKKGIKIKTFKILKYKEQTIAGYNYVFKALINDKEVEIEATENLIGDLSIVKCGDYPEVHDTILPGGWTEFAKPDENIIAMGKKLKVGIAEFTGVAIETFTIKKYKKQVIVGYNYVFIIEINNKEVKVEVYEDLKGALKIVSCEEYPHVQLPGGWSEFKPADQYLIDLKDYLIGLIEEFTGVEIDNFEYIKYRYQAVNGYNYEILAKINGVQVTFKLYEEGFGGFTVTSCGEYPEVILFENTGGWTQFMEIDEHLANIAEAIQEKVAKLAEKTIRSFKLLKFKKQVVKGNNYVIKALINNVECTIEMYESLEGEITIAQVGEFPNAEQEINFEKPQEIPSDLAEFIKSMKEFILKKAGVANEAILPLVLYKSENYVKIYIQIKTQIYYLIIVIDGGVPQITEIKKAQQVNIEKIPTYTEEYKIGPFIESLLGNVVIKLKNKYPQINDFEPVSFRIQKGFKHLNYLVKAETNLGMIIFKMSGCYPTFESVVDMISNSVEEEL